MFWTSWSTRTSNATKVNASSWSGLRDYVYLVPFVEETEQIVLKTIIPSRKANKKYSRREAEDDEA